MLSVLFPVNRWLFAALAHAQGRAAFTGGDFHASCLSTGATTEIVGQYGFSLARVCTGFRTSHKFSM